MPYDLGVKGLAFLLKLFSKCDHSTLQMLLCFIINIERIQGKYLQSDEQLLSENAAHLYVVYCNIFTMLHA